MIEYSSSMDVELIKTNASDDDVALAAWVSNGLDEVSRLSDRKRVKGLINYLYRNQHMSPFEHGSFTFKIDCPIFVTREFQRHRTWSYNEVSGRYTEMKPKFYIPSPGRPLIQQGKIGEYYFTPGTDEQWAVMVAHKKNVIETSWHYYQEQLSLGVAREVARDELPLALYTQFYATANPRNVMQFLTLRTASNALYEIREVANRIEAYFSQAMPLTYMAYKETQDKITNAPDFEKLYLEARQEVVELRAALVELKEIEK